MPAVLPLWRAAVRRDRLQVPVWLVAVAALAAAAYAGVNGTFGDEGERRALLATVMANPVVLLFRGLPSGAGAGAFGAFLILPFLVMAAGFMSQFLAVRHTRAQEDDGLAELAASTRSGRWGATLAALGHGVSANLVAGVLVVAVFSACGWAGAGALLAGAATSLGGLVFLGLGLLLAQVMPSARAANTAGVAILLISYLVAGLGTVLGTASADLTRREPMGLAWASPFGWAENTRPFADNNPWPLALLAVAALVLMGLALALVGARDLGASFLPERQGPAAAGTGLRGPVSLALRLGYRGLLVWAVTGLLVGVLATGLASVVDELGEGSASVKAILDALSHGADLSEGTVVIFFTLLGTLAGAAAVQGVVHARTEEVRGRVEPVWAAAIGRRHWLGAGAVVGGAGVVLTIACAVLGAWLPVLAGRAGASIMRSVWAVAAGQVLAAAVFLGVALVLLVLWPRACVGLAWALVALGLVVGVFGPLFRLPQWMVDLAPGTAAPTMVGGVFEARGGAWLALVALLTMAVAFVAVRRRPLVAG